MARRKKSINLFDMFIGEYCIFVINHKRHVSVQDEEGESGIAEIPMTTEAFLMDIDDNYFYYSYNGNHVNGVLRKEHIINIEVIDEPSLNINEELLNQMEKPNSEEDYN